MNVNVSVKCHEDYKTYFDFDRMGLNCFNEDLYLVDHFLFVYSWDL